MAHALTMENHSGPSALTADQEELAGLVQQKQLLSRAQKTNVAHGQSLTKAIAVLRKTYEELKSVLSALDMADVMDAEDQSLEVIRAAREADVHAVKCPFSASMVASIPLLRLQAIECAEFDNALVSRPWTAAQDAQIKDAVRAAAQKSHFKMLLANPQLGANPHEVVTNMTQDQALLLAEQIDLRSSEMALHEDLDWHMVSIRVPARNVEEIRTRWKGVLRPSVNNHPWSKNEVATLVDIVKPYLTKYLAANSDEEDYANSIPVLWPKVAEKLGTRRTPYACFVQFCSHLVQQDQPDITSAEDEATRTLFNVFRGSWRMMSLHLTDTPNLALPASHPTTSRPSSVLGKVHRDPAHIYRQFRNRLDPALAKGKWTEREDELLIQAVRDLGEDNWASTAARVPGRTSSQCRERWQRRVRFTHISGSGLSAARQRRLNWTREMDDELDKCIDNDLTAKDGLTWVQVAAHLGAKTGTNLTDKRVRDRIQTYKDWLKKTGSRDPALNRPAKRSATKRDDTLAASSEPDLSRTRRKRNV